MQVDGQMREILRHDARRAECWLIDKRKIVGLTRRDIGTLTIPKSDVLACFELLSPSFRPLIEAGSPINHPPTQLYRAGTSDLGKTLPLEFW